MSKRECTCEPRVRRHGWAFPLHLPSELVRHVSRPVIQGCYDSLVKEPAVPTLFPYAGFGLIVVAGDWLLPISTPRLPSGLLWAP